MRQLVGPLAQPTLPMQFRQIKILLRQRYSLMGIHSDRQHSAFSLSQPSTLMPMFLDRTLSAIRLTLRFTLMQIPLVQSNLILTFRPRFTLTQTYLAKQRSAFRFSHYHLQTRTCLERRMLLFRLIQHFSQIQMHSVLRDSISSSRRRFLSTRTRSVHRQYPLFGCWNRDYLPMLTRSTRSGSAMTEVACSVKSALASAHREQSQAVRQALSPRALRQQ